MIHTQTYGERDKNKQIGRKRKSPWTWVNTKVGSTFEDIGELNMWSKYIAWKIIKVKLISGKLIKKDCIWYVKLLFTCVIFKWILSFNKQINHPDIQIFLSSQGILRTELRMGKGKTIWQYVCFKTT